MNATNNSGSAFSFNCASNCTNPNVNAHDYATARPPVYPSFNDVNHANMVAWMNTRNISEHEIKKK